MEPAKALEWLWTNVIDYNADLLANDYVLDLDPTVKMLYPAEIGGQLTLPFPAEP